MRTGIIFRFLIRFPQLFESTKQQQAICRYKIISDNMRSALAVFILFLDFAIQKSAVMNINDGFRIYRFLVIRVNLKHLIGGY